MTDIDDISYVNESADGIESQLARYREVSAEINVKGTLLTE